MCLLACVLNKCVKINMKVTVIASREENPVAGGQSDKRPTFH